MKHRIIYIKLLKSKRRVCGLCLKRKKCEYAFPHQFFRSTEEIFSPRREYTETFAKKKIIVIGYICKDCLILNKI